MTRSEQYTTQDVADTATMGSNCLSSDVRIVFKNTLSSLPCPFVLPSPGFYTLKIGRVAEFGFGRLIQRQDVCLPSFQVRGYERLRFRFYGKFKVTEDARGGAVAVSNLTESTRMLPDKSTSTSLFYGCKRQPGSGAFDEEVKAE